MKIDIRLANQVLITFFCSVAIVKKVLSEVTAGQKIPFRPAIDEWIRFLGALATANKEMEELEEVFLKTF